MKEKEIVIFMPSINGGGVEKNFFLIANYLSTKFSKISVIYFEIFLFSFKYSFFSIHPFWFFFLNNKARKMINRDDIIFNKYFINPLQICNYLLKYLKSFVFL